MYKKDGLENIYCVFDIPFHLGIPDTISLNGSDAPNDELYVAGTVPMGLRTCRIANANAAIVVPGDIEGGDLYGRLNRTRIQIRFNRLASSDLHKWNDDYVLDQAVEAANRLILTYRDVFARPLFTHLSIPDIVHFAITFEFAADKPFTRQIAKPRGPATFGFDQQSMLRFSELRLRLQEGADVDFLRTLELETNRFMLVQDFRMAVISSATLFEAWLTRLLESRFLASGLSPPDVASQFVDSDGIPRSIFWIAKNLIPKTYGFEFVKSPEGIRWSLDCRDVRNKIVHGHLEVVSVEVASRAIQASYDANAFIKRSIGDHKK
jgi:hypothetical protein